MNYLFFDIECANCFDGTGKVCEFGYILVDEKFNEIEKKEYYINPNVEKFDWYVVKNMLSHKVPYYLQQPKYDSYFHEIEELFYRENTMYIGHTTDADAGYLNDESRRYKLPFINFKFFDIGKMHREYNSNSKKHGLEDICKELGIELEGHFHNACFDAIATKEVLKTICNQEGVKVDVFLNQYKDCFGESSNGQIYPKKEISKGSNDKYNRKRMMQLIDGIKKTNEIQSELNNKSICINLIYEEKHYKEMFAIIQLLAKHNCEYKLMASASDYYVLVDENIDDENLSLRYKYVKEAIKNGKDIKVIEFKELLQILNIDESELSNMPYPKKEQFREKTYSKRHFKSEPIITTIGEIIDFSKLDLN